MQDFRALEFHVIRHGQCEHNVQGRFVGQGDSPLTEPGREQARRNGVLLRQLLGARSPDFIASPLHRACATMELVRSAAGLPANGYRADHRLMELNVGDHSWQLFAEVLKTPEHAAYSSDPWNYVRPNGESHAQLHRRVGEFLKELERDAVLVCHAGSARMIRAHYLGLSPQEAMAYEPPHGGITLLSNGAERLVEAAGSGPEQ